MIGTKVLHYQIVEKLGEGGMGVVYKAQDTKLDRLVALKFLPPHLNASDQDKARFVQEAKAAAALNHPNVCSVIDIAEHDGSMFIVMEFVDGQRLRDRIEGLSQKQAIDIGIQIAEGLAAAHDKGIVHRDIKPENIMVRKDGIAQIMDFGLAKLRSTGSKINRLTQQGSTVGTAGYMSPEQVQGLDVDHRSDIFSLGVMLYELLSGQLPFRGVHETALAYEIVNVDPQPMSSIRTDIDPHLDAVVLDCLEKDARERTQSAAQVAIDLKRYRRESSRQRQSRVTAARPGIAASRATQAGDVAPRQDAIPAASGRLPWSIAAICLLVALGAIAFYFLRPQKQSGGIVRFTIPGPVKGTFGRQSPVISPNGETIAFVATDSAGKSLLWIRPISSLTPRALAGTEEATYPFWSNDSRTIAFFSNGKLRRIDANGGPTQTICDAPDGRGGSWGSDGVIIFSPNYGTGLEQVSAAGGASTLITSLDTSLKEDSHRWPCFLSDGRTYIYMRRGATEKSGIYLGSLGSKEFTLVIPSKMNGIYTRQGYLLFLQEGTLMAQKLDAAAGKLEGEPKMIAEEVGVDIGYGIGFFSASDNGTLVLGAGSGMSYRQLVWYDRSGKRLQSVGRPGSLWDLALSPDESKVVFRRVDLSAGNHDLWILDLIRLTESRFTFSQSLDDDPVWWPDGKSIVYDSNPDGVNNLRRKISTGAGQEERLLDSPDSNVPTDVSSDGRYVLYGVQSTTLGNTVSTVWVLPMTGERKPYQLVHSEGDVTNAKFSPDVRWVAYTSTESGRPEVYVQQFPPSQGKWQVSTGGGASPQWSSDGTGIYYIAPNKQLMYVEVKAMAGAFEQGLPRGLFSMDVDRYIAPNRFAVTKDGKRFLVNEPSEVSAQLPIAVVLNWPATLETQ